MDNRATGHRDDDNDDDDDSDGRKVTRKRVQQGATHLETLALANTNKHLLVYSLSTVYITLPNSPVERTTFTRR